MACACCGSYKVGAMVSICVAVGASLIAMGDGKSTDKANDKNPPALSPTPGNTGASANDKGKDQTGAPNTGAPGNKANEKPSKDAPMTGSGADVLGFTMNRIDGASEPLGAYKGKVVLFVNVASQCGYTPQYTGLEKLYRDKKDAGFVILGFPANNFGGQEPGTNGEIAQFCSSKYNVTFPMFEKISVAGADAHPLYKKLAEAAGGEPKWNFTKYLVDRSGRVVAKFDSKVKPDDEQLAAKIDELLAAKR